MNSQLTRRGIAYDFNISPYKVEIEYENQKLTYTFSSNLCKDIFLNKLEKNRKQINKSLSDRFKFKIENNLLCDLRLYITTEKRGFMVDNKEERYVCLSKLMLNGIKLIETD